MRTASRLLSLAIIFLLLVMSHASAFQRDNRKFSLVKDERATLNNEYGAVICDATGQRINYTKEQLAAQELEARAKGLPWAPSEGATAPSSVEAMWGFAAFGSGIGSSNILVAQAGTPPEIYMGGSTTIFGPDTYWYALRYNSATLNYEQIYVSPYFYAGIRRIKVADVIGDSGKEIIVALTNGQINLYDQATKSLLNTITTAATDLFGVDVADLEGDGANELVLSTPTHLYVYSGNGMLKWERGSIGGYDLIVGQMDADDNSEIALTDGNVVDGVTRGVQWKSPNGLGAHLVVADIDNDGRKELIVAETWGFVRAYDVDQQLLKWSIPTPQDIGAIQVVDIDGDSTQELLIGDGQWGDVKAYDTVTQQQEWLIHNPEHGVTNIAAGDVDGNGSVELLWGAGASSTGPDHLYVANWQSRQISWESLHLDGPFVGPEIGDLDGDGVNEMVVFTPASDSGYGNGRILVFNALTHQLRAISDETVGGFTNLGDLKLRDVDGDGRLEIMVVARGLIGIYDFDSANHFTSIWNYTSVTSAYTADAADIDNDGQMDIVAGAGAFIYVYDFATGIEKWHSSQLGFDAIFNLALADVDQDGRLEIICLVNEQNAYVFDGLSRALEGTLTGPFLSLRVQNIGGEPTIILGNSSGQLAMFRHFPGSYIETYRQTLISTPVDGFTIDPRGRVWIGSKGAFANNTGTLTEVTLAGTQLATYSGYGQTLGLQTAFVPGSGLFFTTGSYSLLGFPASTAFSKIGIYSPSERTFYLRNSNSAGFADFSIQYGPAGATPLVGDWDGNLTTTIGVYEPSSRTFYLRNSNTPGLADLTIQYGPAGAVPLAGDWNGDGTTTIGVYDPATQTFYLRNSNTPGFADLVIRYGPAGATPVVGDWDGNGTTTIGVYDSTNQTFYLRNNNSFGFADLTIPYGPPGATPVIGDWDGNGTVTIGVYLPSNQTFYLRNNNSFGFADLTIRYGPAGASPLAGNWNGL